MKRFGMAGRRWATINLAVAAACMLLAMGCSKKEAASTGETGASGSKEDKSNTLVVWSFTNEIGDAIKGYYSPSHPDVNVQYVLTIGDQFTGKLDPVITTGRGCPDIIALEDAWVRKYVESGLLLPLDDLYEEVKDKMVAYPMQVASYDGHVYGMSWQVTPGALFYRRSYAKKYLGTDDPAEVQKYVANFDKFLDTAKLLKEHSNGKCVMLVNSFDLVRLFKSARKAPYVVDDKFVFDPIMDKYFDMARTMHDEHYDAWLPAGSTEGSVAGMNDTLRGSDGKPLEVFAYVLPTWGLHYTLKPGAESTVGGWAMCAGPAPYRWGGTWLGAYKGTKNPEAAKEMIRYIATDDDYLEQYALKSGDVVGNIHVQDKIKDSFSEPFLGGQNHYAQFCEMSKTVDAGFTQATDLAIDSMITEAVQSYILGEKTKEQAINDLKNQVSTELGY